MIIIIIIVSKNILKKYQPSLTKFLSRKSLYKIKRMYYGIYSIEKNDKNSAN